jgi:hypothetical protein
MLFHKLLGGSTAATLTGWEGTLLGAPNSAGVATATDHSGAAAST